MIENYIPNFRSEAVIELDGWESFYECTDTTTTWRNDDHSSEEVINAKALELKAEWTAQEYARSRKTDYPDIGDQLDYIFHNGVDKWKEDIVQPVKDKYPKG